MARCMRWASYGARARPLTDWMSEPFCRKAETASAEEVCWATSRASSAPAMCGWETVPAGIEALVGARVDPTFGPVVVFGLGGILTELLDDVAVLPAPATEADITAALDGLKLARLMNGYRGQPRVAPAPLVNAVAAVSRLIAGAADPATAIDVNPLRLFAGRAVALDAKITGPAP